MASITNLIRGTDREYFDLFERAGANVARAGELLDEIVASVAHCGPLLRHGADRVDRFKPWRSLIGRMNLGRHGLACLGTSSAAETPCYWFRGPSLSLRGGLGGLDFAPGGECQT